MKYTSDEKGRIKFVGFDWGTDDVKIVMDSSSYVMFRVGGHMEWVSNGFPYKYQSPEWHIFRRIKIGEIENTPIKSFEYNRTNKEQVWAKAFRFFQNIRNKK